MPKDSELIRYVCHDENQDTLNILGICRPVCEVMEAAERIGGPSWGWRIVQANDHRLVLALTRPIVPGCRRNGLTLVNGRFRTAKERARVLLALKREVERWRKIHGLRPHPPGNEELSRVQLWPEKKE